MIERYRDLDEVFDPGELMMSDVVRNYQLIRGVLAAYATGGSFCVLCDARRPDLIESWYSVMRAVRSCVLRCRLQLLTWQELTAVLPSPLQKFLATKVRHHPLNGAMNACESAKVEVSSGTNTSVVLSTVPPICR